MSRRGLPRATSSKFPPAIVVDLNVGCCARERGVIWRQGREEDSEVRIQAC